MWYLLGSRYHAIKGRAARQVKCVRQISATPPGPVGTQRRHDWFTPVRRLMTGLGLQETSRWLGFPRNAGPAYEINQLQRSNRLPVAAPRDVLVRTDKHELLPIECLGVR